jgi:hypothetical protein
VENEANKSVPVTFLKNHNCSTPLRSWLGFRGQMQLP